MVWERGSNSILGVFNSKSQVAPFIRARIAKGRFACRRSGVLDDLHERFEIKRINHQEAYSLNGACTDMAEEYFFRLRRIKIGIHHHVTSAGLLRYTQESSWRQDNRRAFNRDQVTRLAALESVPTNKARCDEEERLNFRV